METQSKTGKQNLPLIKICLKQKWPTQIAHGLFPGDTVFRFDNRVFFWQGRSSVELFYKIQRLSQVDQFDQKDQMVNPCMWPAC